MQQLKSEVEGLRNEVKRLELENASKHAELVDSKLSELAVHLKHNVFLTLFHVIVVQNVFFFVNREGKTWPALQSKYPRGYCLIFQDRSFFSLANRTEPSFKC